MKTEKDRRSLDEIVFENREKSYGSYFLRRKYVKGLAFSFALALLVVLLICFYGLYESYMHLRAIRNLGPYVLYEVQKNTINEFTDNVLPPPPPEKKQIEDEASVQVVENEMIEKDKKPEENKKDTLQLYDSTLNAQNSNIESTVYGSGNPDLMYYEVEEMPQFPGGLNGLQSYISKNTLYPVDAMRNRISGTVIVTFCIEADGSVTRIGITKPVHPVLDSVSVQAIRHMPRWRPGRQHGKFVKVWYTIPINFVPVRG
jgi:TonB family protein